RGSQTSLHSDYISAMDLLAHGKVRLAPLITRHFPFEKYGQAYRFIEENGDKVMKILIDMSPGE
ncbi:MAG: Zn-dependent alcohol dehydrogenase, partial [Planctomycetota bacterium]|nr:Zn-dependent alcohol dehydrogenase [Planctomycetota bacterium]